jgi:hypothetical protein
LAAVKKKTLEAIQREALALASRSHAFVPGGPTLRSGGQAVTAELRDELLRKCAAGEYVELEFDVLAYEQKPGEENRNFIRFRDGAMLALGRSFRGMPFLRDHNQDDQLSRGGTIIASRTEDLGEGHYQIKMTVSATAPWLVEALLRGLVTTVSIGWQPTGDVECSVHGTAIFTKCSCWPGDRMKRVIGDDGEERMVRDRTGTVRVAWVFTSADGVETSTVSVPAVPSAHVFEGYRAALAALNNNAGEEPEESDDMEIRQALAAKLKLGATATEGEVLNAVDQALSKLESTEAKLAIAEGERAKLATEVAGFRATEAQAAEDKAIRGALDSGRIAQAEESMWRRLHKADPAGFAEELAKRAPNQATPVGAPRQSDKPAPASGAVEAGVAATLGANGVSAPLALKFATAFGAKEPLKTIAGALGVKEA